MLEDSQSKLQSTDLLLSNTTILVTDKKPIFASQEYPDESRKWERNLKIYKTWAAWKLRYKRSYKLRQLAQNSFRQGDPAWKSKCRHENTTLCAATLWCSVCRTTC